MEPLVSVIIPVYNVRPYLCEALDSMLEQTYQNLEILVIDDGSNDGSEKICDEYAEKDVRIAVIHQKNMGLSTARNVGLNRMTGEFVAFLDPDDAYHPDMIRRMLNAMRRHDAEIAECGFSLYYTVRPMEKESFFRIGYRHQREEVFEAKEALAALAEGRASGCVWNRLYAVKLWETIRFPDGYVYEDRCTLIRIIGKADSVVTVPRCPVRHRVRLNSISQTHSMQNARDRIWTQKQIEDYVRENTPILFAPDILKKTQNQTLHIMIITWIWTMNSDPEYTDSLRQGILERAKTSDFSTWDLRSRAAYQMLRYCPHIVPMVWPVYRYVRLLYAKIIGR